MAFHFLFFPTMTIIRDSWTGAVEFHASFFLISVFMFAWHCWNKKKQGNKSKTRAEILLFCWQVFSLLNNFCWQMTLNIFCGSHEDGDQLGSLRMAEVSFNFPRLALLSVNDERAASWLPHQCWRLHNSKKRWWRRPNGGKAEGCQACYSRSEGT